MAEQSSSHRHGLQGLSSAEAAERLARDGPNQLPGNAPKSTFAIVREVLTEPMFLMLLAAGGVYLALGDKGEALFLLSFVFVVIGITLVQERRTQRALESLRDLSAPRALVLRDGVQLRIAGRDVVCGDLLVLREGDRVAADAQLLSGQLEVDESLLTGESVPAAKHPCASESASTLQADTDSDRVFASTVVTRGTGLARVHATAGHTSVGRIGTDLATTQTPSSPLQQRSRRLVRSLGLLALALAGAQVLLGWGWAGRPLLDSLLSGIALAMALLPEEIPVILTVFLALGAWRIAQRQVLTRRITAVETLGAVTVLAVDKTGTLTMNRMAVAELATPTLQWRAEGAQTLPEALHPLVEWAMLAT
ncbi:MAG: HAD-IC family P-type ATPase, partial [Diaphorobacter nitroreducens]